MYIFHHLIFLIFSNRAEGLLLLDKMVEHCVTEVFTQHALTWLRFMVQIF